MESVRSNPKRVVLIVSLPREWIQEIKHMMMMYSTHGLFSTCTQKISFVFTRQTSWYLHNIQAISLKTPMHQHSNPALLSWRASFSWWRIPINPGPLSGNNCPTPWLLPLSSLPHPTVHITLFTKRTSPIPVFLVRNTNCRWNVVCLSEDEARRQIIVFYGRLKEEPSIDITLDPLLILVGQYHEEDH